MTAPIKVKNYWRKLMTKDKKLNELNDKDLEQVQGGLLQTDADVLSKVKDGLVQLDKHEKIDKTTPSKPDKLFEGQFIKK